MLCPLVKEVLVGGLVKKSCKQKVKSNTSCTKRKQDVSYQLDELSICRDNKTIYPPLYDHKDNTVLITFEDNQIEYPPLYDHIGNTINIIVDGNGIYHDNNQVPIEVSCGIKQLCKPNKLVNQLKLYKRKNIAIKYNERKKQAKIEAMTTELINQKNLTQ